MQELLKEIKEDWKWGLVMFSITLFFVLLVKLSTIFIVAISNMSLESLIFLNIGMLITYITLSSIFNIILISLKKIYRICKKWF